MATSIVWFRRDLRIKDNPALSAAVKNSDQVIPVFIHSPEEEKNWRPGEASDWWLHHSLLSLDQSLRKKGNSLLLKQGASLEVLTSLSKEFGVEQVYWNRLYDHEVVKRDKEIKQALIESDIKTESFNGYLLTEPWEIKNGSGECYKVYTPFSKNIFKTFSCPERSPEPKKILSLESTIVSRDKFETELAALKLLPSIDWDKEFYDHWSPGEQTARKVLSTFSGKADRNYSDNRDIPSIDGTSLLSPHLHFGEISPQEIWRSVSDSEISSSEKHAYLRQLIWRDFAFSLLFNFPKSSDKPLRSEYSKFPWKKNKKQLVAWQKGQTGYPLVDAGMRQLWRTGWMHNRVRMVAGSLLVKHLLQPWQDGAKWFWDTLVDADLANNSMGWQWVAGSGADAAPYFRVFNPVRQGERFDADGEYIKKWVPELKDLPKKWIHCPWDAPESVLKEAGVKLGKNYPFPLVEPSEGRSRALEAYDNFKDLTTNG
jgi:deoxyribodipyrimidine photo-lyase